MQRAGRGAAVGGSPSGGNGRARAAMARKRRAVPRDGGHGGKSKADPSPQRRTGLGGERKAPPHAAAWRTGIPICRALSTRLPVTPLPAKAITPLGSRSSSASLRLNGAALPCAFQSGRTIT